jgi:hypothetical protein
MQMPPMTEKKELTLENASVGVELATFCVIGYGTCIAGILASLLGIVGLTFIFIINPFLWIWSKISPPKNFGS